MFGEGKVPENYWTMRDRLLGPDRMRLLTHEDLVSVGEVIYQDAKRFSLYGVPCGSMVARGLRLYGRTAVECCIDEYSVPAAQAIRSVIKAAGERRAPLVLDLFCGSGNMGFHLARLLGVAVHASDIDPHICRATSYNVATMESRMELHRTDYRDLLARWRSRTDHDVYVVEPPWGDAFGEGGLDLTVTHPPVPEIIGCIRRSRAGRPFLLVLKASEFIANDSFARCFGDARRVGLVGERTGLATAAPMQIHVMRCDAGVDAPVTVLAGRSPVGSSGGETFRDPLPAP